TKALLAPLGVTLVEAAAGCLAGAAVALPLAILLHRSRWADSATRPFLGATQAIPAIALAPLLVLWVGYGLVPIALLCALIVFFPILVAAASGLRHVDHEVVDAARMDGASSVQSLLHIELPLALPWIYAGLRNGFTLSVTGAVVGEMVMGGTGLGTVLVVQRDQLDTAGMVATILLLALVASAAYLSLVALERRSATVSSLVHES
ncbi:MAG TPA: ABC transporter permease subunit, partial [Propionibacteriaceae bacterium]|nr:ABC transporter permease subunit [Propionibacteriaceae bacterium]